MRKFEKNFITEDKVGAVFGLPESVASRIVYMDGEVLPGAFYMECLWFWPGQRAEPKDGEEHGPKPHTHPFDEVIGFFGSNPEDPHDLCGEVELWIEDEQYILTKSFTAFIPAGTRHCPLIMRKIDRPIFHFTLGPGKKYKKS